MKSGRIRVRLERDREELLCRPTFGALKFLMERYAEIGTDYFEGPEKTKIVGRDAKELGPRWWTEVLVILSPAYASLQLEDRIEKAKEAGDRYDSENAPAFAVKGDVLFYGFTEHWLSVPLVSDADDPEEPAEPVVMIPQPARQEPILLPNPIPPSGGR